MFSGTISYCSQSKLSSPNPKLCGEPCTATDKGTTTIHSVKENNIYSKHIHTHRHILKKIGENKHKRKTQANTHTKATNVAVNREEEPPHNPAMTHHKLNCLNHKNKNLESLFMEMTKKEENKKKEE